MITPTVKRQALSAILAGLLTFGGMPTQALAEWPDVPIVAQEELPQKFDLRQYGVVTPVKQQSPWGSCWAFAGIAAAETSILSHLGKTYAEYPLDLSEKHLTWYGNWPVTAEDDPEQAGEGIVLARDDEPLMDMGGVNIQISTLFSSGTGPVLESTFPYRGANGLLQGDYLSEHRDEKIAEVISDLMSKGKSEQEARREAEERVDKGIAKLKMHDYYAAEDDWSIPALDAEGESNRNVYAGFTLRDGNELPSVTLKGDLDPETGIAAWQGLNEAGMEAIKSSLVRGNAIELSYVADVSSPGQVENGYAINLRTWSHYGFEDGNADHSVCVVGYDDNYPASNFTHDVYVTDEEGNSVLDPERSKLTTPPGNGAWLAKNSWGSETDAVKGGLTAQDSTKKPANLSEWGIVDNKGRHTGYFWLSYYDKTIDDISTYEFDTDLDGDAFVSEMHDYMPSTADWWVLKSRNLVSTANEFVAEDDLTLTSVSTHTVSVNNDVEFSIYKLDANEARPEKGELVATVSKSFPYAGYHRVDLPTPVDLDAGQRYSIVSTVSEVNEANERIYSASAAMGIDYDPDDSDLYFYNVAIVNPNESFLKLGKNWVDWSVYQKSEGFKKRAIVSGGTGVVDNFPIKSFARLRD